MTLALSIVVPTYNRDAVLVETIRLLLEMQPRADEIVIVDQTERHAPETETALRVLSEKKDIRWIRLSSPSIPKAMNTGLLEARGEVVLFLDDDIVPDPDLVLAHRRAHTVDDRVLIAGRVIQPWQEGVDFSLDPEFHFASLRPREIVQFMGGNFSLRRRDALRLGGFDENFVKAAYRFEAEFAHRWLASGGAIRFDPGATIHHLKAVEGGTRSFGEHLWTSRADHSVGAYYCALRTLSGGECAASMVKRVVGAVTTRFHLRRPWRIPVTLLAEGRGFVWALRLLQRGPRYIPPMSEQGREYV